MKVFTLPPRRAIIVALIILLTGLAGTTKAIPVDLRTAREAGFRFMNANTRVQLRGVNDLQLVTTYRTDDGNSAFHVFNMSNGFVIVAADDCATPILGYSDEGNFDANNIPVQMERYLQDYIEQIQYGKAHPAIEDELTPIQWASVLRDGTFPGSRNRSAVAPLLTCNWDQNCYYNNLCPEDSEGPCGHTWAGCGPTSMGQIMRFWGYPTTGTGSVTYTPEGYSEQTANFGATTYDWNNMPDQLTSSSTSDQITAVATLLWHCGVAAQAAYGSGGTSTTPNGIGYALVNYFNYSPSLTIRERTDNTSWMMQVKAGLDLGRPIQYNAWGSNGGGHAFVCDGYDANDMLHFNWGWSGYDNGYFMLTALNTTNYEFNGDHIALFDIYPQGMPTVYTVSSICFPTAGGTITGVGTYNPGETCTLTAIASQGYTFANWTEDNVVVSTDANYSFTVTGNRALVANFVLPKHTVTATVNPAGSGTVSITQQQTFGFDDGTLQGWTHIDADGDGYGWTSSASPYQYYGVSTNLSGGGHNNSGAYMCSGSYTNVYNIALTPDNYLVSPLTTLGGSVFFYVRAQDANYAAEHFGVAVSTTGNFSPNDFTTIADWTLAAKGSANSNLPTRSGSRTSGNWYSVYVDFSAYAGQSGYIAIRHFNCTDQFLLCVDDVTITSYPGNQLEQGSVCTVNAVPTNGYGFDNWTQNGVVVSTNPNYSFIVTGDRNLVANFSFVGYAPEGSLNGLFSVSEGAHVRFSQGNLQYIGNTVTPYWKFADYQWNYIGDGQNGTSQYVDRDLFGWGTSGYVHNNACYYPWATSSESNQYYVYGGNTYSLYDQTGTADWGFNAISNGGNTENLGWRTLTIDEWNYVLNIRSTASGIRYAKGTVNGVSGIILLPDNWSESIYPLYSTNGGNYNSNTILANDWITILEPRGAVFLPAAGNRNGTSVTYAGNTGLYWSATKYSTDWAGTLSVYNNSVEVGYYNSCHAGQSVRLVYPAGSVTSYSIKAMVNPAVGGTIRGKGTYLDGASCTLIATADEGYAFTNWMENGVVVSTNESYSFTVNSNRSLIANFSLIGVVPTGAIQGQFTVGENSKVYFSRGNLQYIGNTTTPYWKFADQQWGYLGNTQDGTSQYVDRDLFGWGTSGYNHNGGCYYPWATNEYGNQYSAYGSGGYNLSDQTGVADWGFNAISNGGNTENSGWRTLTDSEWGYVFNNRNTPSGIRYVKATVNGVNGVIILPDNWSESIYTLNDYNGGNYNSNTIPANNWTFTFETNGAVFLPAAGNRYGTSTSNLSNSGFYWSSSKLGNYYASFVNFYSSTIDTYGAECSIGGSVRLVQQAESTPTYSIKAAANLAVGGIVRGKGTFAEGETCTLIAMANNGYVFTNWTENGEVVSTSTTYSFTVTAHRSLVANFIILGAVPEGAIRGQFSVGEDTRVYFSQGNLQYMGSALTPYWKFADQQWGVIGSEQNSNSQYIDRDLFGWGTSGFNHNNASYYPWATSTTNEQYYAYGNPNYSLGDQTGNADWGYNAITNGGNAENSGWRTLTDAEWDYLFNTRETASGCRYVKATVNGVSGIILLPDNWSEAIYTLYDYNEGNFSSNTIPANNWTYTLEANGAVFLPASGYRYGTSVYTNNGHYYWSSTSHGQYSVGYMCFYNNSIATNYYTSREPGYSVRLTQTVGEVEFFEINAIPNPTIGGSVMGSGIYFGGQNATLTAVPSTGYTFVNWTKDGLEVSTEATYSFVVSESAEYVANFQVESYIIAATATNGTVTGTGTYGYGSTCTLVAMPNQGYVFVNWTEDGVEVSTESTYSFEVTGPRTLVANFEEMTNHWTPNQSFENTMDGIGIVLIDGVEQQSSTLELGIFCGEDCRGAILPEQEDGHWLYYFSMGGINGETFTFRLYDHMIQQELELTCGNEVQFEANAFLGDWDEPYEFLFSNNVLVTVSVNPEEAGEVTGAGEYSLGAEATLSAIANPGFAFKDWSIEGESISTEPVLILTVEGPIHVSANFDYIQEYSFSTGWNWWSTYIELSGINGLAMLEEGLGESGVMIKANGSYARRRPNNTWYGSLSSINNETGYKVQTSSSCTMAMTGALAVPSDHPMTINPNGWTWIGYHVQSTQGANVALSNLEPENRDMIKGQNGYARYDANTGTWKPTSFTLIPGKTYLYNSNAAEAKSFVWAVGRSTEYPMEQVGCTWEADVHAYPDNSAVQAVVLVNGEEVRGGDYELGAFVAGVCRGSTRLTYDAYYDHYYAMLLVTGEDEEEIDFRLIDLKNGEVYDNCESRVQFVRDGIVGDFDTPYEVRFTTKTGNRALRIYPNPTESSKPCTLDIPLEEVIEEVTVYSALGSIVSREAGAQVNRQITGIQTKGVYMVKVVCKSGNSYMGRLVVK